MALANAGRSLLGLASRTVAAVVAVVDQSIGTHRTNTVNQETVLEIRAYRAHFSGVVGVSDLTDAFPIDQLLIIAA